MSEIYYENLEKLNGTSIFTSKYPVKILGSNYFVENENHSQDYNSIISDSSDDQSFLFNGD